ERRGQVAVTTPRRSIVGSDSEERRGRKNAFGTASRVGDDEARIVNEAVQRLVRSERGGAGGGPREKRRAGTHARRIRRVEPGSRQLQAFPRGAARGLSAERVPLDARQGPPVPMAARLGARRCGGRRRRREGGTL